MTRGNIAGNLIRFSIPLLLGNLFQQLYNMVDTWVIGQTGDKAAYAAVGNVGSITNILIGFFMGLATGASVVIAQYFGSKDEERVGRAVHTALLLTLVLSVVFTAIGVTMTPYILKLMLHVDIETAEAGVFPAARDYLTIYFSGIAAQMLYNMCSGIMRAVGDSDRPFAFLLVATGINIGLDFLFAYYGNMGVRGVAFATVISQTVSALLSLSVLFRTDSWIRVRLRDLRFDPDCLKKVLKIGLPAGIQTALTAFSNVFVQSYISGTNGAPEIASMTPAEIQEINMSSWTTYSKIDAFFFLPMQSMSLAMTTFVGQNLGINNVDRAKKGTRVAWLICTATVVTAMIPVLIFAPSLARFFQKDAHIVSGAVMLLRCLTPFYLFSCVNQVLLGSIRGAGNSTTPMIIMLSNFVGMRQIYLYIMTNHISNDLLPVGMGYPFGWFCCSVTMLVYYFFFFDFSKYRITKDRDAGEKAAGRA
ncbi:MAG: MATE family efflux transporter [Clostridiales bacterium]|nr:MATE family efflux transporter [Clostridiales bacterium]